MWGDRPLEPLLLPAEVAELFGVAEETALGWARNGRMGSVRTPGGAWRFQAEAVRREMEQQRA